MEKKDNLGEEIKRIMEEETSGMTLSGKTLDSILQNRKKTLKGGIKERISGFLNREVEIPLIPAIAVFAALFVLTAVPMDAFKPQREIIIEIGGSQVILRESGGVSEK